MVLFVRRSVGVVVSALLAAVTAWAEPLRPPELTRAFEQFNGATERLARARAAAEALAAHERPRSAREWEGLPEAFQAATRAMQSAEGLVLPRGPAAIPAEQFRSCGSRASAIARAERAIKEIQGVELRVGELRAQLKERRTAGQAVEEGWRSLMKALSTLPEGSGVIDLFPGRWTDLEAPVASAIRGYLEGLGRLEERLDRGQVELRARAVGLGGAMAEAKGGRDCGLAGQWMGASSHAGTVSGATLELTVVGSGFSGVANLGGVVLPVRSVSLNGTSLVVSLGDGRASLTGTLSADGRAFSGTFSSAEGPASFTLRRQEDR